MHLCTICPLSLGAITIPLQGLIASEASSIYSPQLVPYCNIQWIKECKCYFWKKSSMHVSQIRLVAVIFCLLVLLITERCLFYDVSISPFKVLAGFASWTLKLHCQLPTCLRLLYLLGELSIFIIFSKLFIHGNFPCSNDHICDVIRAIQLSLDYICRVYHFQFFTYVLST